MFEGDVIPVTREPMYVQIVIEKHDISSRYHQPVAISAGKNGL
jgi:hypothetical protein